MAQTGTQTVVYLCSWLCTYMSQMYPLVGPSLNNHTVVAIEAYWK